MSDALEPQPAIRNRALNALILPVVAVVGLWCIWLLDNGLDLDLLRFNLHPRTAHGLIGIITSPLLHAGLDHIANNSMAAIVLGWCLMYFYPRIAGRVVVSTWTIGGASVWLMASGGHHVGASGVIYGIAAFLFVSGVLRRQRTLMALSLLVAFLYGSMIWGVFPIVQNISWEGHLCGAIVGIVLAFIHRHVPPAVSDPTPAFADEEDEDEGVVLYAESDPGDEVNDAELAWKRKLAEQARQDLPGNMSTTWDE